MSTQSSHHVNITSTIGLITEVYEMGIKGRKCVTVCYNTGQFSETTVHDDIVRCDEYNKYLVIITETGSVIKYSNDRIVWFREWVTM